MSIRTGKTATGKLNFGKIRVEKWDLYSPFSTLYSGTEKLTT